MKQWSPDPNVRGGPADYPINADGVRHRPADVQRRRRLDDPLRRRLAAPDAVGLPRQDARRRRRRLAADLRGARALLRPHRARGRRLGAGRRPGLPGGSRPAAAARCRSATASSTSCGRTTGSAGTGGRRRTRSSRRRTAGRHPCAQWGSCMQGCPEGAKASTDVTHWPQAIARGARVLTGRAGDAAAARPRRAGHGRRVRRRGRPDATAPRPTSSCSPRTRSARPGCCSCPPTPGFPDGLANSSGLVGRRLMMHPFAVVTGVFGEPLETWRGNVGSRIHSLAVLRDRRAARVRARREVEPRAVDRRADERRDAGAGRCGRLGPRPPRARQGALRPLPELGHLRRGPARRRQPRRARPGARRRGRPAGAEASSTRPRRTRGGCSTSTSSARASRCSRPARRASTR